MLEIIIYTVIVILISWLAFLPITWDKDDKKKERKLDFSHTKYSGKATITVKIDGLDRKFYRHDLDDRKATLGKKKGESDAMDYTQRLFRRS